MNIARILGQAAGVAGQAVEGYGIDKQRKVTAVLNQQKLASDERRDSVLNALAQAQTRKLNEPVVRERPQTVSPGEGVWNPVTQKYDVPVAATPPTAPNLSFLTVTPAKGQPPVIVGVNPKTGAKVSEVGLAKASDAGGVEKEKRSRALSDLQTALTSFEQTLTTTGSTILPGTDKSVLETAYNDALLKAKEAYNLGVLNGPDYMLMQKVLGDPTSIRNRVLSGGSADEQTKRTVAQISEMRKKFAEQQATLGGGSATQSSGSEAQQLWDAAVKLHGEVKVLQQFGPRPMQ